MARTLVLDTITDPDNSTGNANITLSPDSTTTLPKVDINSGAIDNTTLGVATPSSVAATTLTASGNTTVGGTLGVTGATTLTGAATLSSTAAITGNTTVGGTLGVTGASTLTGNTTVGGTLGVTGDVTVTGGDIKSSGGTTAISVSGANTTLAGTANNIGTTTAGTITSGVTQDGVVRLIKVVNISGTEYQGQNNTNLYVGHDSIPLSVVSGRTYLIETDFTLYMRDLAGDFDDGVFRTYLRLHNDSSARNQSDNSSSTTAYGDVLKFGWKAIVLWSDESGDVTGFNTTDTVNLKGAFTAGSTETRHIHYTYQNAHYGDDMWQKFGSGIQQTYFIYEVTGVTVTSLTTAP